MAQYATPMKLLVSLILVSLFGSLQISAQRSPSPLNDMDHGPFVSSTISNDPLSIRSIFVYKGIAVRVGDDEEAVIVFDTDLLRMASAWTGGFLKWYPARDGYQEWPSPNGYTHFSTGQRPGWSRDGNFSDPRPWKYGPIPKSQGAYKGMYLHNNEVVFSYMVGDTEVLESPGFERSHNQPVFTRTLNLGARREFLSLQLLEVPDGPGTSLSVHELSEDHGYIQIRSGSQTRLVGYRGPLAEAGWRLDNRHLILDLHASAVPVRIKLAIGPIHSSSEVGFMGDLLSRESAVADLNELKEAGTAQWQVLETKVKRGSDDGPFASDELTLPLRNPWNSFLRFSAVDFLSDDRAVLSCFSGEVWIVDGLQNEEGVLKWKRYATGLNQPHGVKVVDGKVYVTGRDQITILHDRNGDGEADFYENFNNDVMAATNFHAFTMNLDTDSKGNFYFAKATPWPPFRNGVNAEITPHHGVLFRLPPDGSRLDVIASGLRNPNGLSIGPNDEIVYSDNEGNWVPTSKIHRIREGGFHGFIPSAHRMPVPSEFEKPIAWVPHFKDNSTSTPIFITSSTWPEALQGNLLVTSYGRGTLSMVLKEEVGDQWQGSHFTLPLNFQSGTIHGRFHNDGHLYVAGLTSWQSVSHGGGWGCFHRVRYTGKPLHMPVAVDTQKGGLELEFAEPLEVSSASNPSNYSLQQWTYPWSSQYGTRGKVYSVNEIGKPSPDDVIIDSIQLSSDRKTVTLNIPELRQDLAQTSLGLLPGLPDIIDTPMGLVMAIEYKLKAADGSLVSQQIHKTIHRVAGDRVSKDKSVHRDHLIASSATPTNIQEPERTFESEAIDLSGARVVDLKSTGITLSYDVTEIRMKLGERLVIRYHNASEMSHNVVVVKEEADIQPVGIAALSAMADGFIPQTLNPRAYSSQEQDRILAASRLAYPGDTVLLEFTPDNAGVYPYICTYSGHFTMMQGRIYVEP